MKIGMTIKNKHTGHVSKILSQRVKSNRNARWLGPVKPETLFTITTKNNPYETSLKLLELVRQVENKLLIKSNVLSK